ncbi:DNA-3-methyladenine glycosylase I [Klebsiella pneumoniae]|uniref:DNA-3-methyladenine glycosylase I n=1 Tax=Klebsiella pneumoniae TaxID=573 RepID=UPI003AB96493|nr:DNA-3-methyladenine glycosylase I [Klebsiella pneumoniae]
MGRPETDRKITVRMICLEGHRTGLSWIKPPKKREKLSALLSISSTPVKVAAMQDRIRKTGTGRRISHRREIQANIGNQRWRTCKVNRTPTLLPDCVAFVNHSPQ